MTERSTSPLPQPDWDPYEAALPLAAPFVERFHQVHGPGFAFALGDELEPVATLEVYPHTNTVRVATKDVSVAVRNARVPRPYDGGVVFDYHEETHSGHLMVSQDGDVSLFVAGRDAGPQDYTRAATRAAAPAPATSPTKPEGGEVLSQIEAKPEEPAALPEGKEEQERIRIVGRLGKGVRVQRTNRGEAIVRFELGEHPDPEDTQKTVWHECYSTKNYAQRIAGLELKRGEEVSLTGMKQQQPRRGKDGKLETKEVVYVFGVKRLKEVRPTGNDL